MVKKILVVIVAMAVLVSVAGWLKVGAPFYELYLRTTPLTAPEDFAQQDDTLVRMPAPQPHVLQPANPLKNVYWGDLHVHTVESFDAVLFGTTATVEDAYRFAKGESLRSPGGELMQLSRPLDFVAITDHAESFGMRTRCDEPDLTLIESLNCWFMQKPNVAAFQFIRGAGLGGSNQAPLTIAPAGVYQAKQRNRPERSSVPICSRGEGGTERCVSDSRLDWARYIELADRHNEPGVLTTFAAYEYSPVLPDAGKHHRNVIFNGSKLPEFAISFLDVSSALDLWRGLEETCTGDCDFLTIPHSMNKGWGLFYSRYTWDGRTYQPEDWRLRMRRERLGEMYQVKGASECALGVGATDEECAFSQVLKPCEPGQETGCAFQTAFARQGLKLGLELDRELGFNPFAFGMIAATDTHNSNPGDVEEWDYVGKAGAVTSPAVRRLRDDTELPAYQSPLRFHTSGGLAAVWAEENTRPAIFAGMKRREAYATSGPRITLRFFAGWGFGEEIVDARNPVAVATAGGAPMGGVLYPEDKSTSSPTFFLWAGADALSAPLQRVQVIKGWIDAEGKTHESVQDVVCSDGLVVDTTTGRCPSNAAAVDTKNCALTGDSGAGELMAAWSDPAFDASQGAFYYVRAIQNPTCRWSTYDAIRLGVEPNPNVPATIRERAWSSPIWIDSTK
ncbi:MAG: hypothetical protein ACI8W3_002992 [Myxococcota bacterium]|jgi:hypothetical protein